MLPRKIGVEELNRPPAFAHAPSARHPHLSAPSPAWRSLRPGMLLDGPLEP